MRRELARKQLTLPPYSAGPLVALRRPSSAAWRYWLSGGRLAITSECGSRLEPLCRLLDGLSESELAALELPFNEPIAASPTGAPAVFHYLRS